ncbi:hypothetical protein ACT8ZV_12875 [Nocardioides sp. MAHUQ-72]|uniref:hypothetical protein n=1 Tax=unclassified Nocardioides TaxID=2615069 RepID=UPI003605F787
MLFLSVAFMLALVLAVDAGNWWLTTLLVVVGLFAAATAWTSHRAKVELARYLEEERRILAVGRYFSGGR